MWVCRTGLNCVRQVLQPERTSPTARSCMGIAQDLLQQADHLASYEGVNPSQASLRRAVSTAYYALFHLLTEDAALRWSGSAEARTGIERAFQHGPMRNTSIQFQQQNWKDWYGNKRAIPLAIQEIAAAFVDL